MALVDLVMPKMGESIMEATILKWHKFVGDPIKLDETVLDIATDKVDSEVPSTVEGTLKEIIYPTGSVVPVGAAFARVETATEVAVSSTPQSPTTEFEPAVSQQVVTESFTAAVDAAPPVSFIAAPAEPQPIVVPEPVVPYVPQTEVYPSATYQSGKTGTNNRFYSPLVLNIANSEGLALSELERIPGTGADGRVSKRDILQYIADKKTGKIPAFIPQQPEATPQYAYTPQPQYIPQPQVVQPTIAPIAPIQQVAEPIVPAAIVPDVATVAPIAVPNEQVVVALQPQEVVQQAIIPAAIEQEIVVAPSETLLEPTTVAPIATQVEETASPLILTKKDIAESVLIAEAPISTPVQVNETVVPNESTQPTVTLNEVVAETPTPENEELIASQPVTLESLAGNSLPSEILPVEEPISIDEITPSYVVEETPSVIPPIPTQEVTPVIEQLAAEQVVSSLPNTQALVSSPIIEQTVHPITLKSNTEAPIFMPQPTPQVIAVPKIEAPLPKLADNAGRFSYPAQAVPTGNVEIVEMDRMRKIIAKHMVDSKQTSAHVTSFAEADVTNMVLWRERVKNDFERRESTKITFTPMFIECIVNVLKRFPLLNASIDGDNIIIKKDFNIGMATALPNGNLIVPVIKAADQLNIVGLATAVNGLANAARESRLKPEDTTQGTFTFTNIGTFGGLMGTPIINQPQVAIVSVGSIKKRAVVIEGENGDTIGIRHMMYLSLSYDHRIIDGILGSTFLAQLAKEMENWDINRQWYSYL